MLLIETKRIESASGALMSAIEKDVRHINSSRQSVEDNFGHGRITGFQSCFVYGVILADVWTETVAKRAFLDEFENCSFAVSRFKGGQLVQLLLIELARGAVRARPRRGSRGLSGSSGRSRSPSAVA